MVSILQAILSDYFFVSKLLCFLFNFHLNVPMDLIINMPNLGLILVWINDGLIC